MKRVSPLLLAISLLTFSVFLPSCSSNNSDDAEIVVGHIHVPMLLQRKTPLGTPEETKTIQDTYNKALADLKENPDDPKPLLSLASVFILEGRVTGNSGYYGNAA